MLGQATTLAEGETTTGTGDDMVLGHGGGAVN
jgi:hypothetical protein